MSFRREKFVPKGGPDGGDGGRGGDVKIRVKSNLTSLLQFQYNQRFVAENGGNGRKQQMHGKSGSTLFVNVPPGTVVWDDEANEIVADLTDPDETVTVCRGGRGGLGNTHFKTSVHQAPRIFELGEPGEERWLRLELRLIADVGLVGLPNAGKSTLLAASSAAQPKIADYPFTTLEPNLGVVEIGGKGGQTYVMADVPGLIEGAAGGAGLGHEFLRHVTRTKVLVHVVDTSGGLEGRDPLLDYQTINDEIRSYSDELATKPMLVALNKIDLVESRDNVARLTDAARNDGHQVFSISGATGEGVTGLLNAIGAALRELQETAKQAEKPQERRRYTLAEVDERAFDVSRVSDDEFRVTGIAIERLTKMTNFNLEDAVTRFQRVLERSGISAELERQGVHHGDIVVIAGHELTWGEQDEEVAELEDAEEFEDDELEEY
jgi:GTP-binding protein